jgi:hypothetical protein
VTHCSAGRPSPPDPAKHPPRPHRPEECRVSVGGSVSGASRRTSASWCNLLPSAADVGFLDHPVPAEDPAPDCQNSRGWNSNLALRSINQQFNLPQSRLPRRALGQLYHHVRTVPGAPLHSDGEQGQP